MENRKVQTCICGHSEYCHLREVDGKAVFDGPCEYCDAGCKAFAFKEFAPEAPIALNREMAAAVARLDKLIEIQCVPGTVDFDPYMQGLANGLLAAKGAILDEDVEFVEAPRRWLKDRGRWKNAVFGGMCGVLIGANLAGLRGAVVVGILAAAVGWYSELPR